MKGVKGKRKMKKANEKLILLNCVFVVCLVSANIVACKVVTFQFLTVPAAIVSYPITQLVTDIIGEIWGKEQANKTVKIGVICQIISIVFIGLAILLPVATFADNQDMFKAILGNSFRVVIASLVGYLASQSWDVWVFHKIRNWYIKKN